MRLTWASYKVTDRYTNVRYTGRSSAISSGARASDPSTTVHGLCALVGQRHELPLGRHIIHDGCDVWAARLEPRRASIVHSDMIAWKRARAHARRATSMLCKCRHRRACTSSGRWMMPCIVADLVEQWSPMATTLMHRCELRYHAVLMLDVRQVLVLM